MSLDTSDRPDAHARPDRGPIGASEDGEPPAGVHGLLVLGDTALVLAHRLSEWCAHAPTQEEDLALANVALDLLGQARILLAAAGELEGRGRDEDSLAYLREPGEYRNICLVELPRGDFAVTVVRQFLYDAYAIEMWGRLAAMPTGGLPAGLATRAQRETAYHVRHSGGWVVRLGDGTEESHARAQAALASLWSYTGELAELATPWLAPSEVDDLHLAWRTRVDEVLEAAGLEPPSEPWQRSGGTRGVHTEYLGHLLATMQSLARTYPGARW